MSAPRQPDCTCICSRHLSAAAPPHRKERAMVGLKCRGVHNSAAGPADPRGLQTVDQLARRCSPLSASCARSPGARAPPPRTATWGASVGGPCPTGYSLSTGRNRSAPHRTQSKTFAKFGLLWQDFSVQRAAAASAPDEVEEVSSGHFKCNLLPVAWHSWPPLNSLLASSADEQGLSRGLPNKSRPPHLPPFLHLVHSDILLRKW